MNTTPSSPQHFTSTTNPDGPAEGQTPWQGERALVLGGGGSTGNAWLIGVIAGLFDTGLDVTSADLTIGTSAGSTAAAQIAGATPPDLFAATLEAVPQHRPLARGSSGGGDPTAQVIDHLARVNGVIASSVDAADMRRKMGDSALALEATSDGTWSAWWRATVAARIPGARWPERAVLITAVDAHTGEPVVFDRTSGVDLVDAVAASCAGTLPYALCGRKYIDGGYRTNAENADLANGYARVMVLSPFGGRSLQPPSWGMHLATQVEELRANGSMVETIFPDGASEHMFGANAMDVTMRPAAAQAGYVQGAALAESLAEFWGATTA